MGCSTRANLLCHGGFAVLAFCASLASAPSASAAGAAEASAPGQIEEVVVTARRVEENIQQVPVAVTAVSQQRLRELAVSNIVDLTKIAPALQTDPSASRQVFRPSIRGYGQSFGSAENSVIAYVAEVPNFPRQFFDLRSIQVLKGPQGTLFGETAVGGAVLFEPQRPGNEYGGYVTAQVGNHDYRAAEFAADIPVIKDKVLVRVAGQLRKRDGYVQGIPSYRGAATDLDNVDTDQFRISVVLKPLENLQNYTMFVRSHEKTNGTDYAMSVYLPQFLNPALRNVIPANSPQASANFLYFTGNLPPAGQTYDQLLRAAYAKQNAAGPFVNYLDFDPHGEIIDNGVVNQTKWDINDAITIRNIFGMYWTQSYGNGGNFDGNDLPFVDSPGLYYNANFSKDRFVGGWPNRTWTDEVQVQGKLLDGRLNWQAGYYYRNLNNREFQATGGQPITNNTSGNPASAAVCASLATATPCTTFTRTKGTSRAFYAQGTFAVTDAVHLTGGIRQTQDQRSSLTTAGPTVFVQSNGLPLAIGFIDQPISPTALTSTTTVPKISKTTYNLTADWRVTKDIFVYLTRRTGYKSGGINASAAVDSPLRVYGPENITSNEAGVKADFNVFGMPGRADLAAYSDTYENVQRSTVVPGQALTVIQNLANVKNRGFELEASFFPASWLELGGYLSVIDVKYDSWTENKTCATEFFRPQCFNAAGVQLGATTSVVIDHSNGKLTVTTPAAGAAPAVVTTATFKPDVFGFTSRSRWAFTPKLHLDDLTGEKITLGANIYHRTKWTITDAQYSIFAGQNAVPTTPGVFGVPVQGAAPFVAGYTLVDLRADWRNIHGGPVSAALSVTNLTDELYGASSGNPLTICGCIGTIVGEPRMWFAELRYDF